MARAESEREHSATTTASQSVPPHTHSHTLRLCHLRHDTRRVPDASHAHPLHRRRALVLRAAHRQRPANLLRQRQQRLCRLSVERSQLQLELCRRCRRQRRPRCGVRIGCKGCAAKMRLGGRRRVLSGGEVQCQGQRDAGGRRAPARRIDRGGRRRCRRRQGREVSRPGEAREGGNMEEASREEEKGEKSKQKVK